MQLLHSKISAHLYYRPQSEGDNALGSIRPSVRLSVCALAAEPFDLRRALGVITSLRCLSVCLLSRGVYG